MIALLSQYNALLHHLSKVLIEQRLKVGALIVSLRVAHLLLHVIVDSHGVKAPKFRLVAHCELEIVASIVLASEKVQVDMVCSMVVTASTLKEVKSVLGEVEQLFKVHDLVKIIDASSLPSRPKLLWLEPDLAVSTLL